MEIEGVALHELLMDKPKSELWRGCYEGVEVAVKVPKGEHIKTAGREATMLKKAQGPHVIRMHCSARTQDGRVAIVTDYLRGMRDGSLPSTDDIPRIRQWIDDALRGLAHVHRKGMTHGDVRWGNMGPDNAGRIVLLDFGNAFPIAHAYKHTVDGKPVSRAEDRIRAAWACAHLLGVTQVGTFRDSPIPAKCIPMLRAIKAGTEGRFGDTERMRQAILE